MTLFLGNEWKERKHVYNNFRINDGGEELLIAYYNIEGYDGTAYVLYRQDGKLYEVFGSHCSCYGLEEQWEPEEVSIAALQFRLDHGKVPQEVLLALQNVINNKFNKN